MKDTIRVRIAVKVITKEKSFDYYYNNENTFLYSLCYIKQKKKIINPYDIDGFVDKGIYYLDFYFKMHPDAKPPKLSFGLYIFENGKDIEADVKRLSLKVFDKTGSVIFDSR